MDLATTLALLPLLTSLCAGGIQKNKNYHYDDGEGGNDEMWETHDGGRDVFERAENDGGSGDADGLEEVNYKKSPEPLSRPTDLIEDDIIQLKALEGHNILLRCPARSRSVPFFCEWRKDDELIHQGWMRFRTDGLKMKIKDIRMEDGGIYTCLVINGYGQVAIDMELKVFAQGISKNKKKQQGESNITYNKKDIQTSEIFKDAHDKEIQIKKKNDDKANNYANINDDKTNINLNKDVSDELKEQRDDERKESNSTKYNINNEDFHYSTNLFMVAFLLAPILIAVTVIVILLKYISKGKHLTKKEHETNLKKRMEKIDKKLISSKKNILKKNISYHNFFATTDSYETEEV